MPDCLLKFGMRAVAVAITLAVWPLLTAAMFADLLTDDDPRLGDW